MLRKGKISITGFTLIELLVVVTILAVLSLAGIAAFRNSAGNARDAKRKADVDAISKALEDQFNPDTSQYPASLSSDYFISGEKPQRPEGGNYPFLVFSPATNPTSFRICALLEAAPSGTSCPSATAGYCYCKTSSQGKYP